MHSGDNARQDSGQGSGWKERQEQARGLRERPVRGRAERRGQLGIHEGRFLRGSGVHPPQERCQEPEARQGRQGVE